MFKLEFWSSLYIQADTSMFIYKSASVIIIFLVYVDDILVTGNSFSLIQRYISDLHLQFSLKDMGDLSYFLSVQVTRDKSGMHLSQTKYICDILSRAQLVSCKSCSSPIAACSPLSIHDGQLLESPSEYRSLVGALQYCTLMRPDICYLVNKLCQFLHAPTTSHMQAVKRLLRYLKGTLHLGILFTPSPNIPITCYTDADWASCPDDRRSSSGFCTFLGPNLVSWNSSKQKVVSRSSAESEYRGMSNAAAEISWVQSILHEIGIVISAPLLLCDNLSAMFLAANPVMHNRTKHIEIDQHFIR